MNKQHIAHYQPVFFRLIEGNEEEKRLALLKQENRFDSTKQDDFKKIPGSPIAYWVSSKFIDIFEQSNSLHETFFSDGLTKTGNNDKYLRFLWEVSFDSTNNKNCYMECIKGGEARKYYGNIEYLVNWTLEARHHYRNDNVARITPEYLWNRSGVTWTKITSGIPTFRYFSAGQIAETAGPVIFLSNGNDEKYFLGLLN